MEEWRPISGFEGLYEVSNLGRVRSLPRPYCSRVRVLRPRSNRQGYLQVALYAGGGRGQSRRPRGFLVHRLVCAVFMGVAPVGLQDVNHKDGNKQNNSARNLEWTNDHLNVRHAFDVLGVKPHGRGKPWLGKFGKNHHASKPVIRTAPDGSETPFDGISDAARQTGLSFKHISACCRGLRKRHGGFQWRFAEPQQMKSKSSQLDSAQIRQGDVFLVRKSGIDRDVPPADKDVVLAYGESSGHKHQFMARSRAGMDEGMLAVSQTAVLKHEEHAAVTVNPGLYDLPVQVEHTDEMEPRVVAD